MKTRTGQASHRQAVRELEAILDGSPVSLQHFDRILSDADFAVKNAYVSAEISPENRRSTEKAMLISASIPDVLMPALSSLLTTSMDAVRAEVDEAELYFTDISWLGLTDDQKSVAWRRNHVLDGMRMVELPLEGSRWRCTRCCTITEGWRASQTSQPWIRNMQRTCFCGSWWMAVDSAAAV